MVLTPFAVISLPGEPGGSVATTVQTNFAGGDLSVRRKLLQGPWWRFDGFAGYQQLHLGDELGVGYHSLETVVGFSPALIARVLPQGSDSVRTRNNFYGASIGGVASATIQRWSFEGYGSVALGVNDSELNHDQARQIDLGYNVPGPFLPLGMIRRLTSIADSTTYFGTVWEGGVKVGYQLGEHLRLTMGYTGLWWWNVRRAQEQFDPRSPENLTGTTTNFFAHMISWGAELRY